MTEQPHPTRTVQQDRPYLPGMGRHALLSLYDPLTRLIGARGMHQRLVDQADLRPGLRVLEIGCGTGNLAILAARQHPGVTVRGLDPDPRALARAAGKARRAGVAVEFDRGFADQLPYPSGSVDRVLSSLMLHHLDAADRPAALQEVARVLAPGGSVHVLDLAGAVEPRHRSLLRFPGRAHQHRHDGVDVGTLLRAAGLTDVRETGRGTSLFGPYAFHRADR